MGDVGAERMAECLAVAGVWLVVAMAAMAVPGALAEDLEATDMLLSNTRGAHHSCSLDPCKTASTAPAHCPGSSWPSVSKSSAQCEDRPIRLPQPSNHHS